MWKLPRIFPQKLNNKTKREDVPYHDGHFWRKNFFSARMRKLQQLFLLAKERCARLMFCAHQNLSCTYDSGTKGNVRSLIHKTLDVMTMWRRTEAHNFPFILEEKCTSVIVIILLLNCKQYADTKILCLFSPENSVETFRCHNFISRLKTILPGKQWRVEHLIRTGNKREDWNV